MIFIDSQSTHESYQGLTDPARLILCSYSSQAEENGFAIRPHSGECSYTLKSKPVDTVAFGLPLNNLSL